MAPGTSTRPSLLSPEEAAGKKTGGPARPKRPGRKPQIMAAVAGVMLIVAIVVLVRSIGGGDDAAEASRRRTVIDAKTGEVFHDFYIEEGTNYPRVNPRTGEATLYAAERCFWNRDGTVKLNPTYVLVKRSAGINEDTICPDCGRKVVAYNPPPPPELLVEAAERAKGN